MTIIGKILGGATGFIVTSGNVVALVVGLCIGHLYDRACKNRQIVTLKQKNEWARVSILEGAPSVPYSSELIFSYCQALFTVLGRLLKLDGRVSEAEIQWVEQLMVKMGIQGSIRDQCIAYFQSGKSKESDTSQVLSALYWQMHPFQPVQHHFIETLVQATYVDSPFNREGWVMILEIASKLNYPESKLWQLRHHYEDHRAGGDKGSASASRSSKSSNASSSSPGSSSARSSSRSSSKSDSHQYSHQQSHQQYQQAYQRYSESAERFDRRQSSIRTGRPSKQEALATLGITSVQWQRYSRAELKRTYRKLMSQYHPDKLIAAGASQADIERAKDKTQQVRAAYDRLLEMI